MAVALATPFSFIFAIRNWKPKALYWSDIWQDCLSLWQPSTFSFALEAIWSRGRWSKNSKIFGWPECSHRTVFCCSFDSSIVVGALSAWDGFLWRRHCGKCGSATFLCILLCKTGFLSDPIQFSTSKTLKGRFWLPYLVASRMQKWAAGCLCQFIFGVQRRIEIDLWLVSNYISPLHCLFEGDNCQ